MRERFIILFIAAIDGSRFSRVRHWIHIYALSVEVDGISPPGRGIGPFRVVCGQLFLSHDVGILAAAINNSGFVEKSLPFFDLVFCPRASLVLRYSPIKGIFLRCV